MNPDIIQFQCGACQSVLTVPANLAGVSGPCPTCGQTVTSPAATPAFGQQAFGAPSFSGMAPPVQAPSPQENLPQYPSAPPVTQMPMQPMPGSLQSTLQPGMTSGLLGGTSGFPAAPAVNSAPPPFPSQQSAPSFQPPGLGQTMMAMSQPLASGFPQPSSGLPAQPGGFLPPQRAEGQFPTAGSLPQAPAGQAAWGSGLNPAALSGMPADPLGLPQRNAGHSSLIPGSPGLSMGSLGDSSDRGSLMSQAVPSAPLPATPPEFQPGEQPPPLRVPESSGTRSSRSAKKPKRGANVFMVGLAVLLLGGFLAAAGWLFREPILQLANRFLPASVLEEVADISKPQNGENKVVPPVEIVPAGPKVAESAPVAENSAFDPSETTPVPLKATPATPEELAKLGASQEAPSMGAETSASPLSPAMKSGTLVEVANSDSIMAKQASSDVSNEPLNRNDVKIDVPAEAKPAAEALQRFLAAETLEERLKYTLAANDMKATMERYYQNHPSGPILVDAMGLVRFDPKPQMGAGAHALIGLESKTWEFPIIVMLEERDGSFKVDWLSFVEFKDRLLENFLRGYQEGPAAFHVSMTRTHYFEDKVPNSSNKEAFRMSPAPPNPFTATVFVDKDSALSKDLKDKIPWGAQVFAIVELEWMKLGNQSWVQMSSVPQLNWYSVPSAPKAVKANSSSSRSEESNEVPTATQKAVPIGR